MVGGKCQTIPVANTGDTIANNMIYGTAGIYMDGLAQSFFTNNSLYGNSFYCGHCSNTSFIGNYIDQQSLGSGPALTISGAGNTVSANSIINSVNDGIWITFADYNTVTGNYVANNQFAGISVSNSTGVVVSGNTLSGNMTGGASTDASIDVITSVNTIVSGNHITGAGVTGPFAIWIESDSTGTVLTGNTYSGIGATSIYDRATSSTRYTQWDRLTLNTTQLGSVAYSPLYIYASTSASSTFQLTQLGIGKLLSFFTATSGEVVTVSNAGKLGLGSSTPSSLFSLSTRDPIYVASTTASSTFGNGINLSAGCFSIGGTGRASGPRYRWSRRTTITGAPASR
jgi:parallel beta-helix repeat protein